MATHEEGTVHHQPLTIQGRQFGATEIEINYTDFEAAAASDTVSLALPANVIPRFARYHPKVAFASPSGTAHVLTVGDAGDPDGLHTVDAETDPAGVTDFAVGTDGAEADGAAVEEASYTALITLTITTDTCDNLTAGSGVVVIFWEALRRT